MIISSIKPLYWQLFFSQLFLAQSLLVIPYIFHSQIRAHVLVNKKSCSCDPCKMFKITICL